MKLCKLWRKLVVVITRTPWTSKAEQTITTVFITVRFQLKNFNHCQRSLEKDKSRDQKWKAKQFFSSFCFPLQSHVITSSEKRQIKIHFVERGKKVCEDKKAVYFMITTLTYANNFDIMKGMMNIKHIKIKISIWITTTSCGYEKKKREEKVYSKEENIAINLLYYYFVLCIKGGGGEDGKDFEFLFSFYVLCTKQEKHKSQWKAFFSPFKTFLFPFFPPNKTSSI